MRKIPGSHYVLFGVLAVFIVSITFLISTWFSNQRNQSLLLNVIFEVKENELLPYLSETSNMVLYFASGKNQTIKSFEKEFRDFIQKKGLQKEIVYVNTDLLSDKTKADLNSYWKENEKGKKIIFPNIIFVENGIIIDQLNERSSSISIRDVESFFKKYEVIK